VLSGQFRLRKNETISDRIAYLQTYLQVEHIFMQIWIEDYQLHKDEIEKLQNCSFEIFEHPEFDKCLLDKLNEVEHHANFMSASILNQIFGIEKAFQLSLSSDFDLFIRCRYDCNFVKKLDQKLYFPIFEQNFPVVLAPTGGDWCGGIGDVFYIMNKNAALNMQNYLEDSIDLVLQQVCPLHAEVILRTFLINCNKTKVFRFPFLIFINSQLRSDENYKYNSDYKSKNFCITDSNKFVYEIKKKSNLAFWEPEMKNQNNNFESIAVINSLYYKFIITNDSIFTEE
jgi:hypothetical protein